MKKLLLIVFLFSSSLVEASHQMGGEIYWDCLSNGEYRFTLVLYRDCNTGIPLTATTEYIWGSGPGVGLIACTKVGVNYFNNACDTSSCNSGVAPNYGTFEQHIYQSAPVKLTGSPPAGGWHFIWSSCCRDDFIENLDNGGSQGISLRAVMYPFVPNGSTQSQIPDPCYDSSPRFDFVPIVKYCMGNQVLLNHKVDDPDNDSVYYEWAQPKQGYSFPLANVIWDTTSPNNYAFNNPFPDTAQNPFNVPASLDGNSGLVSFQPFSLGVFTHCIKASSFRNGQLISEVFRDMPVYIVNCTGASQCNATPPTYSQVNFSWNNPADSIYQTSSMYGGAVEEYQRVVKAKPGDSVKFIMDVFDADSTSSCKLEDIQISAQASPYALDVGLNGCAQSYPCPRLISLNANGGFVDTLHNTVAFKWLVDCKHNLGPAEFVFTIENNSCPYSTVKTVKLLVDVEVEQNDHPAFIPANCMFNPTQNSNDLTWNRPDTATTFAQYMLWHSTGGKPVILDSIQNYNDTTYAHYNPPFGLNRYWIRTVGGCNFKLDSVDVNDSTGMINLKTIGLEENNFGLSYYPQPMTNDIVFEGFAGQGEVLIEMINAVGERVCAAALPIDDGKVTADVADLPTGMYVFVLFWDGHSSKIKLVKHE